MSLAPSFPRRFFVVLGSILSTEVRRSASCGVRRCPPVHPFPRAGLLGFLLRSSVSSCPSVPPRCVVRLLGGFFVGRRSIRSPELVFLACGWVLPCPLLTPCHGGSLLGVLTGFLSLSQSFLRRFFARRADRFFILSSLLATEVFFSAC